MRTLVAMGLLSAMLCFVGPNPAASEEPSLSPQAVTDLFSGNTEDATGLRKNRPHWTNFCAEDGTIRGEREGKKLTGRWYVDTQGRHCVRWDHKDRTKCDEIVPEDDGTYLRVRDGEVVAKIKILEGNPHNL